MPTNFWAVTSTAAVLGLGAVTVLGSANLGPSHVDRGSVLDYGAVCDGRTDDRAALTRGAASGRLYVPPNATCYSAGPIEIKTTNGLEIAGGDKLTSILIFGESNGIKWTGANPGGGGKGYPSLGQGVSVHGIGIETTGFGTGTALSLTCTSQPWVRVYNTTFQGYSGGHQGWTKAISLQGCTHSFIDHNYIWPPNDGIMIAGSVGIEIMNNPNVKDYGYWIDQNQIQNFDAVVYLHAPAGQTADAGTESLHLTNNGLGGNVVLLADENNAQVRGRTPYAPPAFWVIGNDIACDKSSTVFPAGCMQFYNVSWVNVISNQGLLGGNQPLILLSGSNRAFISDNMINTTTRPYLSDMDGVKVVIGRNYTGNLFVSNNEFDGMVAGVDLGGANNAVVYGNAGAQRDVINPGGNLSMSVAGTLQLPAVQGRNSLAIGKTTGAATLDINVPRGYTNWPIAVASDGRGIFHVDASGNVVAKDIQGQLPSSAGPGGLYVCVDNHGNFYKKASCR